MRTAALAVCATVALATPGHADTGAIVVRLAGLESADGAVAVAMWSGETDWLGDDSAVREGWASIAGESAEIVFEDVPFGEYAISVYHDENGNQRLDTGLFGIPKEPVGASNDAKMRFGPPRYDDARFKLDRPRIDLTIQVKKLF